MKTLGGGRAVVVAVAIVAGALVALAIVLQGPDDGPPLGSPVEPAQARNAVDDAPLQRGAAFPGRLLVRAVDPRLPDADGALYVLRGGRGSAPRRVGAVDCRRVYASSAGPAICLTVSSNGFDYEAATLGENGVRTTARRIAGVPSRARVSPDGRYGAFTTFALAGQGYFAETSRFSTFTRIVDMRSGRPLLRLEDLDVTRGGRRVKLEDAELWGVAFGPDGRYYATLAPGQRKAEHLLIEGRVGSSRARVVAERVECPSLSPDGTRIAYKRRAGTSNRWRLHVRDLRSGSDTALAERRSIDDQPEWIGDDLIAYSDGRAVYAVPADGSGDPELLVAGATSPSWLPD